GSERFLPSVPKTGSVSTASRISTVISIQLSATMTVCRTSFCCGAYVRFWREADISREAFADSDPGDANGWGTRSRRDSRSQRTRAMKIRTVIGAASAAFAIAIAAPASAHDAGEKVTRNFEQAIPNIPGKSLIAVVVDYPPGGASPPHTHAKSAFIYA